LNVKESSSSLVELVPENIPPVVVGANSEIESENDDVIKELAVKKSIAAKEKSMWDSGFAI
jgi:hypothetical protein